MANWFSRLFSGKYLAKVQELTEELEQAQAKQEELLQVVTEKESTYQALLTEQEELQRAVSEKESAYQALLAKQKELVRAASRKGEMHLELRAKEEELQRAIREKEQAVQALQAKQQEPANGTKRVSQTPSTGTEDQNLISELQERIVALKEKLDKTTKELDKTSKELEEAEEEAEEVEADLKKEKAKLREALDRSDELERSLRKSEEELADSRRTIDRLNEDLISERTTSKIRGEALDFVKEVLTAKVVNNRSAYDQKVDEMVRFFSSPDLANYVEVSDDTANEIQRWQSECHKTWIQGKTTIAFIGEFSAGKTSIVNRILTNDNPNAVTLPVSTKATTAIPTYISSLKGRGTKYQFYTPDSVLKQISAQTFRKINKEVLAQVGGVSSMIKYFVMAYDNKALDGLSILDTPGFSSQDAEDGIRTLEVINECDALFWVVDVNNGTLNRRSLDTIKEHLRKPLYVIINKVDTKAESEVKKVEDLIHTTTQQQGVRIQGILRFSQNHSIQELLSVIGSLQRTKSVSFLDELARILEEVCSEIENEKEKIENDLREAYAQEKNEFNIFYQNLGEIAEMSEYAAGIPRWETHFFSSDCYEMSQQEFSVLKNILTQLSEEYPDYLNNNAAAIKESAEIIVQLEQEKAECQERLNDAERVRGTFVKLRTALEKLAKK